jgi:hypothetical protein
MKTQQRKFVVEVKQKRRSALSSKSIWGKADLQALTLEVQADAPHLFNNDQQPGIASGNPEANAGDTGPISAHGGSSAPTYLIGELATALETGLSAEIVNARTAEKSMKPRPQPQARKATLLTKKEPRPQPASVIDDELIELTKENERLKSLLTAQLLEENMWLREKLAKYDAQ